MGGVGVGEVDVAAFGVLVGRQRAGEEGRSIGYAPHVLGVRARASGGRWKKIVAGAVAGLGRVSCKLGWVG